MNFTFKRYLNLAIITIIFGFGFTSCGDDNDDNNQQIETPKYEAQSAKYIVSDQNSQIKSVEFTASGNYVITTNSYYSAPLKAIANNSNSTFFRKVNNTFTMSRAINSDGIIYGTYTINADGVYVLDGFGTITVNPDGDSYVLTVKTTDGTVLDLNTYKGDSITDSSMTNKVCRTWNADSNRILIKVNGRTIFDKTAPQSQSSQLVNSLMNTLKSYADDEDLDDDDVDTEDLVQLLTMVKQVIFSKSGTYMVIYQDNTLAISTWKWQNESKGIASYSWDYDNPDNDWYSGLVNVQFDGAKLLITESMIDAVDADDYDITFDLTYIFTEAK